MEEQETEEVSLGRGLREEGKREKEGIEVGLDIERVLAERERRRSEEAVEQDMANLAMEIW